MFNDVIDSLQPHADDVLLFSKFLWDFLNFPLPHCIAARAFVALHLMQLIADTNDNSWNAREL